MAGEKRGSHPNSRRNLQKRNVFSSENQPENKHTGKRTQTILKELFETELPNSILSEPWLKKMMDGDKTLEKAMLATAAFHALKGSHKHLETLYKISGMIGTGSKPSGLTGLEKPIAEWNKRDFEYAFKLIGETIEESTERPEIEDIEYEEQTREESLEEEIRIINEQQNKELGIDLTDKKD